MSDYLDDIEIRDNVPLPTKFHCRVRIGRSGRLVIDRIPSYSNYAHAQVEPINSEEAAATTLQPSSNQDYEESSGIYIYPTVLHSRLFKSAPTAAPIATAASGSASMAMAPPNSVGEMHGAGAALANRQIGPPPPPSLHRQLHTLPPTMPPERANIPNPLSLRERDVYAYSDSDDELVNVQCTSPVIKRGARNHILLTL